MKALVLALPALFVLYRLVVTGWHPYYMLVGLAYILPLLFLLKKEQKFQSYWLGIMTSYCLLDHIFSQVSVANLKEGMTHLNYWYLFPSVSLILLGHIAQTIRWGYLLSRIKRLFFFDLFPSMMIGYLINNLLPAKVGEIVKAYHLGKSKQLSKISILATVAVEKVFDGLTILVFLLISLFFLDENSGTIRNISLVAGALYVGGLLFLMVLYFYRQRLNKLYERYLPQKVFTFLTKVTEPFSKGLEVFQYPTQIFQVFLASFIMWTFTALSLWPVLWMFDFNAPFYTPFFILSFICFGQTMPAAPAGIGIISFASVLSLEIVFKNMGVPVSDLLYTQFAIFSLLVNAVMVIPEIVIGAYYMATTDMGFSTMIKKSGEGE